MKNLTLKTLLLAFYTLLTETCKLNLIYNFIIIIFWLNLFLFLIVLLDVQKRQLIIFPVIQSPRKINIIRVGQQIDEEDSRFSNRRFILNGNDRFQPSLFFRKNEFFTSTFRPLTNNFVADKFFDKIDFKSKSSNVKSSKFDFDEKFESFFGKSTTRPTTTVKIDEELNDGEFRNTNEETETTTTTTEEPPAQANVNNNNNNFIVNDKVNANFNNNNLISNDKSTNINNNNNNVNGDSGVNVNFNNNNVNDQKKAKTNINNNNNNLNSNSNSGVNVNFNNNNVANSQEKVKTSVNNNNNNVLVNGETTGSSSNFNNNNLVRFGSKGRKGFSSSENNNLTFVEELNKQSRRTINININNNNGFPEKRDSSSSDSFINNNNNNVVITGPNSGSLNLINDNRRPRNDTDSQKSLDTKHQNPLTNKLISGFKYVFNSIIGTKLVKRKIFNSQLENLNKLDDNIEFNNLEIKKSLPRF